MSKLAEIGLDIKQIVAAVDTIAAKFDQKLTPAIGKTDKAMKLLGKTLGAAAILQTMRALARNALDLGKNYEESVNKYVAGSAKLKAATGGIGPSDQAGASVSTSSKLGDLVSSAKRVVGEATAASAGLLKIAGEGLKGLYFGNGRRDAEKAMEAEAKRHVEAADAGKEVLQLTEEIAAQEDAIAKFQQKGLSTAADKFELSVMEVKLAEKQQELAEHALVSDRAAANAAKERAGSLKASMEIENRQIGIDGRKAEAKTKEMQLEQAGMKIAAERVKTEADYQEQITKAIIERKPHLAAELETQKNIALAQLAVKEHNMTSRELIDERTAARKFARDKRKTDAAESALAKRAETMSPELATPGSRLDRYFKRQQSRYPAGGGTGDMRKMEITGQVAADIAIIKEKVSSPPNH